MKDPQKERVKILLTQLMRLPEAERFRQIDQLRNEEAIVGREVLSLLLHAGASNTEHDEDSFQPGHVIGRYRVVERANHGGMGIVVRAVCSQSGDSVAIKVIRRDTTTQEGLGRFRHERQLLSSLRHPNVVQMLDHGETHDGRPFIAMEWIDGQAIDSHCRSEALGARDRIALFTRLCDGVNAVHGRRVVHRDLKPSNVLVTHEGEVKLLDFGVAKRLDDEGVTQSPGEVPLTVRYASPEQLLRDRRQGISPASDVYSLGVILYQLLTGRLPFDDGAARLPFLRGWLGPTRPSRLVHDLSRAEGRSLDRIVRAALRRNPRRRFQTAGTLATNLRSFVV